MAFRYPALQAKYRTKLNFSPGGLAGLAQWWTKQGTPPPTSLRCTNCSKLVATIRTLYLVIGLLVVALFAALALLAERVG